MSTVVWLLLVFWVSWLENILLEQQDWSQTFLTEFRGTSTSAASTSHCAMPDARTLTQTMPALLLELAGEAHFSPRKEDPLWVHLQLKQITLQANPGPVS